MNRSRSRARELYERFKERNLLDDRREFDVDDLMRAYKIRKRTAKILFRMLHKK